MANLYKVRDLAMDEFFVVADDETAADAAYTTWVQDPANGLDDAERLPVQEIFLCASDDAAQAPGPLVNFIPGS
jgi:hypothetical protein